MPDRIGLSFEEMHAIVARGLDKAALENKDDADPMATVVGVVTSCILGVIEANNAKILEDIQALIARTPPS